MASGRLAEKESDRFCSSLMCCFSIMSNTRLCHCCFSAIRNEEKNENEEEEENEIDAKIDVHSYIEKRKTPLRLCETHSTESKTMDHRILFQIEECQRTDTHTHVMPVFRSSKKKSDEYCCKIFTMDAELQFTIEVSLAVQCVRRRISRLPRRRRRVTHCSL